MEKPTLLYSAPSGEEDRSMVKMLGPVESINNPHRLGSPTATLQEAWLFAAISPAALLLDLPGREYDRAVRVAGHDDFFCRHVYV